MPRARHKQQAAPSRRLAQAVAVLGALAVIGGVYAAASSPETTTRPDTLIAGDVEFVRTPEVPISRSGDRTHPSDPKTVDVEAPEAGQAVGSGAAESRDPAAVATDTQWLTEDLNVWTGPGESYELLTVMAAGRSVEATGRVQNGYAEVVRLGSFVWVNATYLADEKPEEVDEVVATGALSGAPCPDGSSIESGLTSSAIAAYRAACAAFPTITSWGGYRAGDDGYHGSGQAIDIMVTGALGDEIAAWAVENANELGVIEILWSQQIWTAERASEGWRTFSDRGSTTANHYDHVHIAVY